MSYITYEVRVYPNGSKYWYLNEKYHREDGPAVEDSNGFKSWYLNGKRHREDGPAIEYPDGTKYWFLNGELHREDGPAIEHSDGTKYWFLNGERHREKDWKKQLQLKNKPGLCDGKVVEIEGTKYRLVRE